MKRMFILFSAVLFVFGCAGENNNNPENTVVSADLKLELSFGEDESLGDYLLAAPKDICISSTGDIYVIDEDRIKIYDNSGNPKQIICKPGQGPGEFEYIQFMTLSETGYLTVQGSMFGNTFKIFSPEFEYVSQFSSVNHIPYEGMMENRGLSPHIPNHVISFGGSERIYGLESSRKDTGIPEYFLFYESADGLTKLADYPGVEESYVRTRDTSLNLQFFGYIYHAVLPGKRAAYTFTAQDRKQENGKWEYILHVKSFDGSVHTEISHEYVPVPVTGDDLTIYKKLSQLSEDPVLFETIQKRVEDKPLKAPLQKLISDGPYVFAVTYTVNETGEFLIDVFNCDTGKYICSTYFPKNSFSFGAQNFGYIKNGYLYRINRPDDDFPVVEKLRINPKVYGR
ncbi:hypothetical protein ACFL7D_10775 [candidate division KSB1 bacterium]